MHAVLSNHDWAFEVFGNARLGNAQRPVRAVCMLRRTLEHAAGCITEVFKDSAERQGAYDFVEGPVAPSLLMDAVAAATLRAVSDDEFAYAVMDGSSLTLTDRLKKKGFGSIGKRDLPTRGLKVVTTLIVTSEGVPAGLCDQQWWWRGARSPLSRCERRKLGVTEIRHLVDAVYATREQFAKHAPHTRMCIVIDREGDCSAVMKSAAEAGSYIIRASQNHRVLREHAHTNLWAAMRRRHLLTTREVDVPAAPGRSARRAVLAIRSAVLTLDLPDRATGKRFQQKVGAVWALERRPPRGEDAIEWMLLTTEDVSAPEAAEKVLDGYCLRWRIEDFHRAWKSGHCDVESTQLRHRDHVIRWATFLAVTASRVEQLKHLARTNPDAPASIALSEIEIEGLIAARRRARTRKQSVPDAMPTIAIAVQWIAELGGYTGKSSGGPPGTVTIGRGLQWLVVWSAAYEAGRRAK